MSALVYLHRILTFLLHKNITPTDSNTLLYFLMYKLGRTLGKTFKLILTETTKTYSFHKFI